MPTALDNGRRSPKKLLRSVLARLRGDRPALSEHGLPPGFEPVPLGPVRTTRVYVIDGENFSTLDEFYDEVERVFAPDLPVRNLDDFNGMLYAGWHVLNHKGFVFRWENHQLSKERLSYPETVRWLELRLERCHPDNRARVAQELAAARAGGGPTAFDWLVNTVRDHGPGGEFEEDKVTLELE